MPTARSRAAASPKAQMCIRDRSNAAWEALRQLSLTAGLLESFGLEERVRLDFSLVNSMDYYNGVIFQGFLPGLHTPVPVSYTHLPSISLTN